MASAIERTAFDLSLRSPWFFRHVVRHELYRRYGRVTDTDGARYDPERVHEAVMNHLPEYREVLQRHDLPRQFPELEVEIKGRKFVPFGTAAGMDKNGEALDEFSYIFGFQEPGTVVVPVRLGNKQPRVAVDAGDDNMYNAQGFPSKGLEYFVRKIKSYRESGGTATIYASICGLPQEADFDFHKDELRIIIDTLNPYVDGFVWNPFSPNTDALKKLRTPNNFYDTAKLMRSLCDKLLLVKMGPYEKDQKEAWLSLADPWISGKGDGFVVVNTFMVPKEEVCSEFWGMPQWVLDWQYTFFGKPIEQWGYGSAGKSGRFLAPYRMRAIRDLSASFFGEDVIIFGTGGIFDGDDAYETFLAGADAIEGYTPYAFYGLGLARELMGRVSYRMQQDGYKSLQELRAGRMKREIEAKLERR